MSSIGLGEILIILAAAYFIAGPEKFSKMIRRAGREIGKIMKMRDDWEESLFKEDEDDRND